MLSGQSRIVKQAKFTYSPLGKALEKQIKTIEDQGIKTSSSLKREENQELHSIEELFQKKMKIMKLKRKQMKLQNGK